jgi:hypothetical protein
MIRPTCCPTVMRTLSTLCSMLALLALGSCATRSLSAAHARGSALSPETPAAPAEPPAVALSEHPPLPDDPEGAPLWRGLTDPDAAVIPLPSEPGQAWGSATGDDAGGESHAR